MQGYFTFEFRGAKAQTYELIDYLTSRKEEDDLHGFLFYCMRKAWDYDEKGDNEETSVEVSMSNVGGSGNIRGLDIESIVNELCSAVPSLSMNGYFELLDANSRQNFTSIAGSDSYEEEYVDDMRCLYCQQSIDPESPDVYVDDDGDTYCNVDCYKNYLIEGILDEDEEADEEELQQLSIDELKERFDAL